ncbi:dienelactone hydrolase family protein [Hyphomicrobium sp.]|uniref:alpha/beta hydrolase n=1 Tax=Hyphomicrobium sp. TaxID=82 RepID=UPI001DEC0D4A|nr:dienelactone hydrolase family protein [Hyphomicrobium sp.]MBY0561983.1 dienelactone hydrolase family protein [Hyphomicrobium sp.]
MTTLTTDLIRAGAPIGAARAAMNMVHGRGASAEGILGLADAFDARDVAYVAPQAEGGSWYPYSFMSPISQNEPYLSRALETLGGVVEDLQREGMPSERIVLLGFSQGACLALEFAARNARRFGGVVALSGGLIGPEGMKRNDAGTLEGTPVFLGCSDVDSHIPLARVHESTALLTKLGGDVTEKIYRGMGHTIVQDEVDHVKKILQGIGAPESRY